MNRRKLLKILGISSVGAAIFPFVSLIKRKRIRVGDIGEIKVFVGPPNPNYRSYIFDKVIYYQVETEPYSYFSNDKIFLITVGKKIQMSPRIAIHDIKEAFVDNKEWRKIKNFRESYIFSEGGYKMRIRVEFEII